MGGEARTLVRQPKTAVFCENRRNQAALKVLTTCLLQLYKLRMFTLNSLSNQIKNTNIYLLLAMVLQN